MDSNTWNYIIICIKIGFGFFVYWNINIRVLFNAKTILVEGQ